MKAAEFEEELERVGLAQKHVDEAFAWIRKQNKQGVYNIFYYGKIRPGERTGHGERTWAALDKEENGYFMKEAGTLVYLLHAKIKTNGMGTRLLIKNENPMD